MDTLIKYSDLESWDEAKLTNTLDETRKKLYTMRINSGLQEVKQPHLKAIYKKNVAKILTFRSAAKNK